MEKIRTGIVNVTGYAGMELARLLSTHPGVEITSVTGRSAAGQQLGSFLPHLAGLNLEISAELDRVELAFLALPHRESAAEAERLLAQGTRVIDISADFRLKQAELYPKWYDFEHPCPERLAEAVYGLPELYREQIKTARLIANPGCYPTAAILALAPALEAGIVGSPVIIDAKSGISGAGRNPSIKNHYCEAGDNVTAYALDGHRHLPEIIQELDLLSPREKISVTFVPHLVPTSRGILATCYARLKQEPDPREIQQLYSDFYREEPFIRITASPPHTKHTTGANYCLIHPVVDSRTNQLIVISVIDNLVKGAAGQAIQNMNLMLGFEETTGLGMPALYP
ncbi:MAG: N-acetyl-gamma-glutamyl-phosphate reductase [Dehalococcoidaceae bacterium]|nr:N-acetyl-gamma-glutamyl-phosphate reductase [Dehalococcoidaceae bacterium]